MNKVFAFAAALIVMSTAAAPVLADDKSVAWDVCFKQLSSNSGIPRDTVKTFSIRSIGTNQFEVTGHWEGRSVSCKTKDGKAKWISIR